MARQKKFYTIYDMMEERGVFEANKANYYAKDGQGLPAYEGPVQYPKMLYHPEGETRVLIAGTLEDTKRGVMELGEQREIISVTVNSAEEEKEWLAKGWHTHPARAIAASGGVAPPMSSTQRLDELEADRARLEAELAEFRKMKADGHLAGPAPLAGKNIRAAIVP